MIKRVLVTGAAGFVGRNVVDALRRKGLDVVATDVTPTCFSNDVQYFKLDILDAKDVQSSMKNVDSVIHLAASPLVASLERPMENMRVNLEGTLNILESCRKNDIRFLIFSSASSVVGEVRYNPVDEKHPCVPKTPYATAKLACEEYIRVYGEVYGLRYLVFRFFNVYGPWQYPESGGLIPSVMRKVSKGESISIFGDGSATRDFVYVEDVADYCVKALQKEKDGRILNMGTGIGTSILNVVRLCGEITGLNPVIEFRPARKGEIDNFYADTKNLAEVFGSSPGTTLKEGLRLTYSWMKQECL